MGITEKSFYFDKLRRVVTSCYTAEQFKVALSYVQRIAGVTHDNEMTAYHLRAALLLHRTIRFKPFPPAYRECNNRCVKPAYNLDPDFLFKTLWSGEPEICQ